MGTEPRIADRNGIELNWIKNTVIKKMKWELKVWPFWSKIIGWKDSTELKITKWERKMTIEKGMRLGWNEKGMRVEWKGSGSGDQMMGFFEAREFTFREIRVIKDDVSFNNILLELREKRCEFWPFREALFEKEISWCIPDYNEKDYLLWFFPFALLFQLFIVQLLCWNATWDGLPCTERS
jgi:hypothetical protein